VRFAFITAEKAEYPVRTLCRCLAVPRSAYYAWQRRGPTHRQQVDAQLTRQLRVVHAASGGTYGRPRLHDALHQQGVAVGPNRVARLMRAAGLVAKGRRRYRVTTDSAHAYPIAPDRVRRRFTPRTLNRVWAADLTACPTQHGWCYLAVILDLASRRVVGWAVGRAATSELVCQALRMALLRRRPARRLVHHSDRGCQYAGHLYQRQLAAAGIRGSMSRRGNCWDNAPVESFLSTLKAELLPDRPWPDHAAAHAALRHYIEEFYNRRRLHSALGYHSPVAYEQHLHASRT
jgi:transposase InsO family protein